jgi:hypothetical protein
VRAVSGSAAITNSTRREPTVVSSAIRLCLQFVEQVQRLARGASMSTR